MTEKDQARAGCVPQRQAGRPLSEHGPPHRDVFLLTYPWQPSGIIEEGWRWSKQSTRSPPSSRAGSRVKLIARAQ